jgi:hypothetical protein
VKTGDKRQATILSLVAFGAIGFFVIRMLPEGGPKSLRSADSSTQASSSTGSGGTTLPLTLINDPFSHPLLAGGKAPSGPDKDAPPTTGDKDGKSAGFKPVEPNIPDILKGQIQNHPDNKVTRLPDAANDKTGSTKGAGDAKDNSDPKKTEEKRAPVSLTLNAVMSAGKSTAFIAIGQEEPRSYEVGQTLPTVPPFKVTAIHGRSVEVTGGGKKTTLVVGDKKDL